MLDKRCTFTVSCLALAVLSPALCAQDAAEVQEVVVTGTFIRSSNFQQSSPVETLGRLELESKTQSSVASFLADLPANVGGGFGQGGGPSGATINLRGLGSAATLVLLNGRRAARVPTQSSVVDVNTLVPQIMIRSFEILKDGASALYGSDAVAGVANIITRGNFTGFELQAQDQVMTHDTNFGVAHPGDARFGALWGAEVGKTHLVVAFEYSQRDLIPYAGLPGIQAAGDFYGRTSLPGQVRIPLRDSAGVLRTGATGSLLTRDPSCGAIPSTVATGTTAAPTCTYVFFSDQSLFSNDKRYQIFVEATHDFSDHLQFKTELGYAQQNSLAIQTASSSISSLANGLLVPGDNPGVMANATYRARDGNGALLFAAPNPANPTIPLRDSTGRVVVTGTNAANGIPFYEDVLVASRFITSQGGLPTGGTVAPGQYSLNRPLKNQSNVLRASFGLGGEVGYKNWHWDTNFTYSVNDADNGTFDVLPRELQLAAQGYAGGNCNVAAARPGVGNCAYFNPFLASAYAAPGSAAANTSQTIDFFLKQVSNNFRTRLGVYDAVLTGELFNMPAGAVSAALGAQYRTENWDVDNAANQEIGNSANGTLNKDISAGRPTRSAFMEIAVPLYTSESLGSLDLNAAARYESSGPFDTTDPKVGLLYSTPNEFLQLRGSWGTSFLAPTLFQQYTQSTRFVNVTSRGVAQPRLAAIVSGNPDLDPQSADAYNLGVLIKPLQNLKMSLDYWHYKFDKLITTEDPQTLVNIDEGPTGPTGRVLRDSNGNVIQIVTLFFNAAQLTTSGFDFAASYATELGGFGDLALNLDTTFTNQYDYQASPTSAVYKGSNNLNGRVTSINPSTKWRSQLQGVWSLGANAVTVTVHHSGAMKNDVATVGLDVDQRFKTFMPIDIGYSYTFGPGLWGTEKSKLSAGVINVGNSIPYFGHSNNTSAFGFGLYDYRGRLAWVRASVNF